MSDGFDADLPRVFVRYNIDGDYALATSRAVLRGTGEPGEPFVISDALFVGADHALKLTNTTAHVVIEDVDVHGTYADHTYHWGRGIWLDSVENVTIRQVRIQHVAIGIAVDGGTDVSITESLIEGMKPIGNAAVWMEGVSRGIVANNMIHGVVLGVQMHKSSEMVIDGNSIVVDGEQWSSGVQLYNDSNRILVTNNTITLPHRGLGIIVANSWDNTFKGNGVFQSGIGILFTRDNPISSPSHNNTAKENILADNRYGLSAAWSCTDCAALGNIITRNEIGIDLSGVKVEYNIIYDNDIGVRNLGAAPHHPNNAIFDNRIDAESWNMDVLDLRHTWWGSASGPDPDRLKGEILYDPWLDEPPVPEW